MSRDKVIEGLSHLQLMQLLDGEHSADSAGLGGEAPDSHADEVADGCIDWEAAEEHYADELEQLSLLGSLVRDVVEEDARADSIADAVMARIEAGELPEADADLEAALGAQSSTEAETPDNVIQLPARGFTPQPEVPAVTPAANDNGGRIFALAAAAAAVAAGLFLWGRSGEQPMPTASAPATLPAMSATAEPKPAPETTADAVAVAAADDTEDDSPVEIAAVDFGQLTGSVFYVPGEDPGASTAVVWVTDNEDKP